MATKLLLTEDVEDLGHKGEIVNVKPGYARNYLLPQGFAIIADKNALRLQERLREERRQKALVDKKEAEETVAQLEGLSVVTIVKVDHEGHMYGSVSAGDIVRLLEEQAQLVVEKRAVQLKHPIKETGVHTISLRLKEGVNGSFALKVMSEEEYRATQEEPKA
jgi:large subunit ribosomal protein L9